jgi:DNA-binding Xre family transcriptional regulator
MEFVSEEEPSMISYEPLWQTMKVRGATTYTLQVKGQISSSTIRRLKAGESVSTNTLDALCKILHCNLTDIVEYLPDTEN